MNSKFILQSDYKPNEPQLEAVRCLDSNLKNEISRQVLLGVTGCGKTFTLANVIAKFNFPTLIIAHNKTLAAQLYSEMKTFFPKNAVEYFVSYYDYYQPEAYLPATDTYIEKDASINDHIEQMRLSATRSLCERSDTIIVASVSAIYGLGDPETYNNLSLYVTNGDNYSQEKLLKLLTELQYHRNDFEMQRGTFRVRGEILDIFPAETDNNAIRLEFQDDIINNISSIDKITGKTIRKLTNIRIFPKTHYATKKKVILDAVKKIKLELHEYLNVLHKKNKLVEAQRLKQRIEYDIEMLLELGYCTGIENYSRYLSGRSAGEPPYTLINYFPKNSLLVIDESHVTLPQLRGMYEGDHSRKTTLIHHGFRLPSALDNRPLKFDEFEKLTHRTIFVSATPGEYELKTANNIVELLIRPTGLVDPKVELKTAKNQVDDLFDEITSRIKVKERVLVTTLTKKMAEDLTNYLFELGIKVKYIHSEINTLERIEILRDLRIGIFDVLVGVNLLREGLDLPEVSLVAILDADKEGFLRSTQALIQTSGRAARHINGKVIMYTDRITTSIKEALDEMQRRREIQNNYNAMYNITPKSIKKKIIDSMSKVYEKKEIYNDKTSVTKKTIELMYGKPNKVSKEIKKLEKKMLGYARNLEFEKASKTRDEIAIIRQILNDL